MIDDALFERVYDAFISAKGGERHRLEAALAVIAPRLEALQQALDSATETNRVLAKRLKEATCQNS
jgi:hypothetical protein